MLKILLVLYIFCFGFSTALPEDPILIKLSNGPRYQYASDSNGELHLVDLWVTLSDFLKEARYNPDVSNAYHLFTRQNPSISQPLVINNAGILSRSNYNSNRRTVLLIHGWFNSATSDFNAVLLRALLAAEDINVIVLDWSSGANSVNYREVNANAIASGAAAARFIIWLNQQSGSVLSQYYIIGHGIGGHQAGIVGRNLGGQIPYITGLDPALIGWTSNPYRFQPSDGLYTEVIHTNYGIYGYFADLGHVDFYPNGGISMPGCDSNACDHARGFLYLAESFASGGFNGRECWNYYAALLRLCEGPKRLRMGGLLPKTGEVGVYLVDTNATPPFSLG